MADRFALLRSANYPECNPNITTLMMAKWTFADVVPLLCDDLRIAVRKRLERCKEWTMIWVEKDQELKMKK